MPASKLISVVIVTYNSESYIVSSLRSVLNSHEVTIDRVVIVDNDSSDDTVKLVEKHFGRDHRIVVVRLKRNYGFPLACNIGVARTRTDFVVCMNPDVIVDPQCFANLLSYIEPRSDVAAAQPKILHPKGFIDSAGGVADFLGHGFHIGKFERDEGQHDKPKDVLYACFACAMVRRSIYFKLGGLDSRYFLYNEDLDFCWRSWLAGYRVVYVPSAVAYHVGQHATRRLPYHAIYFGRRNRLFTLLTNYSLPLALPSSFVLTLLYLSLVPYAFIRGDRNESRIMISVLASAVKHLKYLMRKRSFVSELRKVGDPELFRRGLITPKLVGLVLFVNRLYREALGMPDARR